MREQMVQIGRGSLSDGSIDSSGVNVIPPGQQWFLAKITGVNTEGANPAYEWSEIVQGAENTHETDLAAGLSGSVDYYPAYELRNNADVPTGTVVRMWPSYEGDYYNFDFLDFEINPDDFTIGLDFNDIYSSSVMAIDHKAQYYTEQLGATVTLTLATGTITLSPNGTIATTYLDGGTASIGTRILYNSGREAAGHSLNGILVFTGLGSTSTGVTLVRATDYDSATEITPGSKVTVTDGDEFHDKTFILKNDGTVTVNTTDLIFDLHAEKQDIGWSSLILESGYEAVVVLPHICRQIRVSTSEVKFQMQGVEPVKERTRRVLWNVGSETIIVKHQHSSAAATWRINCATGRDLILYPGGLCFLDYDDITERWRAAVISDRLAATKSVTANQAPLDLELNRLLRLVPDANMRLIQGLRQLPATADGNPTRIRDEATLTNDGTFTLALTHADGAVSAHERIICPGATSFELRPSEAVALVRDNGGGGWSVLSMSRPEVSGSIALTIREHTPYANTFTGITKLSFENAIVNLSNPTASDGQIDFVRTAYQMAGVISEGPTTQHIGSGVKSFDSVGLAIGGTTPVVMTSRRATTAVGAGVLSFTSAPSSAATLPSTWAHHCLRGVFFNDSITLTPTRGYLGPMGVNSGGTLTNESATDGTQRIYTNPCVFTFANGQILVDDYDGDMGNGEITYTGGTSTYPWQFRLLGGTEIGWHLAGYGTKGGGADACTLDLACAYGSHNGLRLDSAGKQSYFTDSQVSVDTADSKLSWSDNNPLKVRSKTSTMPSVQVVQDGSPDTITTVTSNGVEFTSLGSSPVNGAGLHLAGGMLWHNLQPASLPPVPGVDGTYTLQLAVVSGAPTFSWV